MTKLYIAVSIDEFELPYAVADSLGELAEMTGSTKNIIASSISHGKKDKNYRRYQRVIIEDDEDLMMAAEGENDGSNTNY